ncbi:hypothetical protein LSTR_LSTR014574 [Laodelphax striatellus]|uniref:LITAF domain-containing protein n=1 Tax=Laodelphax striatellus TaxID=195883 RepID=A0A482WTH2_LAOST|nr:hypothetical protein LSTR_LSTR014574 [Laodelphax striatellus]
MEKCPMPPTNNMPSAPPAYDDDCRPPPYYAGPNVPLVQTGQPAPMVQAPAATVSYPQQQYVAPITQAPMPGAMVVQNTDNIVVPIQAVVGPHQVTTTCPMCRKVIKSSTEKTVRWTAHLACVALCIAQCYCCCCIPYCMDSCHSVHHTCPHCKYFLGTYNK